MGTWEERPQAERTARRLTRRKLLASMGMVGAAAALYGAAAGGAGREEGSAGSTYGKGGPTTRSTVDPECCCIRTTIAELRAASPGADVVCWISDPGQEGVFYPDDSDVTSADNGGTILVDGSGRRWKRLYDGSVQVNWFGAKNDGTDAAGTTASVLAAIQAMRSDQTPLIQYIGGPTITAYKSGTLEFGRGVYALLPDTFDITQDLGLTIKGQGSRGKNQAIPAATTLLFVGASSGFGFKFTGNGARSAHFEDLDLNYQDANFTGDLVDSLSCPGLSMRRVRLGCLGGFAATRVQSARSLIRSTYDEFLSFESVVFDGAVDGWWSDNSRTLGSSTFGGWGTTFDKCTFYDIAGRCITHDATRTRAAVNVRGCAFNPINVNCVRAIDVDNVEGYVIEGNQFTPSTSRQPSEEWFRILGSTGRVSENAFSGAAARLGSTGGANPNSMDFSRNRVACSEGLTITGGVVTGSGNEYSTGTFGVKLSPAAVTCIDIGRDIFKAAITHSYIIPADSALLGGRISYNAEQDHSASKFANASGRISIDNVDRRVTTVASLPATGSPFFTGRTYNVTAAGTFTLPAPILGTRLRVMKSTATALTIAAAAGTNFAAGAASTCTSAAATAGELGAGIEFVALSGTTWIVQVLSGNWTFS